MGIYEPFQQVSMWGDTFKGDSIPNASTILQVDARLDNKVNIHEIGSLCFSILELFYILYSNDFLKWSARLNLFLMIRWDLLEMSKKQTSLVIRWKNCTIWSISTPIHNSVLLGNISMSSSCYLFYISSYGVHHIIIKLGEHMIVHILHERKYVLFQVLNTVCYFYGLFIKDFFFHTWFEFNYVLFTLTKTHVGNPISPGHTEHISIWSK